MARRGRPLTFEHWLSYVFDRPVAEPGQEWYWDAAANGWDEPAAEALQFMTRAFEGAATLLEPYSDAQLNQGLWYLADNACSSHMFALFDPSLPWADRRRGLRSLQGLYEQCFARRCTPHLGHLDEPGAGPLNPVCYMWWDILPIAPQPGDPARAGLDREILGVMEATLGLDSIACQESALHGLGHWQSSYPRRVTEIVETFLQRRGNLRPGLRAYALNARRGCVL